MSRRCVGLSIIALGAFALHAWPNVDEVRLLAEGSTHAHIKLAPGEAAVGEALFSRSPESYAAISQASLGVVPDLGLWRRIAVPPGTTDDQLEELVESGVATAAFVAPIPELASARTFRASPQADRQDDGESCPIVTPLYEPYQGYLGPAPSGIDATAAWRLPGGLGQNVWFADVEGGWNDKHEDLPGDRITHVHGRKVYEPGWMAHGTAVLGEVVARPNDIGMVGIAPAVERIVTASVFRSSPAAAIDAAAAALRPGDVLLIELHAKGPRRRFLPMEYWDDVYEAIVLATTRGVVVVEAAGNGGENLDHWVYRKKLRRTSRDSGAIMVGAGAPARKGFSDRSRLDFSNYGSRLDVQGWGRRVATLDYGDLQSCEGANERDYTDYFGGTSSASPIVAGAALLIQSIVKERGGSLVKPRQMRALLADTGSPQTDGPHGPKSQRIGPRPDLARAIEQLRMATSSSVR